MAIIDDASSIFQVNIHSGTGQAQAITFDGNSDLSPDLIWVKNRNEGNSHVFIDTVRGVTKTLQLDNNTLESTGTSYITAFGSDGFTVGTADNVNYNGSSLVSWNFKKQTGVFDIQTWTGTGSNRTIAHDLGVVPSLFIMKEKTGSVNDWTVYYGDETDALQFNESNATSDSATRFNDTKPTSSVFSLGTGSVGNRNNSTYVGYFFGNSSVSRAGLYYGAGNADGAIVHTGFKPAFLIVKNTAASSGWFIYDNKRNPSNPVTKDLSAQVGGNEATNYAVDFLSTGFKLRNADADLNGGGTKYVYIAMAEQPFVTSTANGSIPCTAF